MAILVRTENGEQTQNFLLQFLTLGGLKRTQKKISARLEKKENIDPIAIAG